MVDFKKITDRKDGSRGDTFLKKLGSVPSLSGRVQASREKDGERRNVFLTLLEAMPDVAEDATPPPPPPAPPAAGSRRSAPPADGGPAAEPPPKAAPPPATPDPSLNEEDEARAQEIDSELSSIFDAEGDIPPPPETNAINKLAEAFTPPRAAAGPAAPPPSAPASPPSAPEPPPTQSLSPGEINQQLAGIFSAREDPGDEPPPSSPAETETERFADPPPQAAVPDEPMYPEPKAGRQSLQNFVSKILTELDTIFTEDGETAAPSPGEGPRVDETVDEGS